MLLYLLHPDPAQIVDGPPQADHSGDIGSARLETGVSRSKPVCVRRYVRDRSSAHHQRRKLREEFFPHPQRAGSRWSEHLMAGETEEVASQPADIDWYVRN